MRLPDLRQVFRRRAERFHRLASKPSPVAEYLVLMAALADAQQRSLDVFPEVSLPGESQLALSRRQHIPPLDSVNWPRDPAWLGALDQIMDELRPQQGRLTPILDRLTAAAPGELETEADRLLAGDLGAIDIGAAPLIAAALQVYWTAMAGCLDAKALGRMEQHNHCPVCGSQPVASVVETGGAVHGLRYLCCALCASQWNLVRIQCVQCGSSKSVAYYGIAETDDALKAEACDACKTYLKLMNREKDTGVEPFADDLASVTLDLLMAEAGFQRLSVNPLLIPSE